MVPAPSPAGRARQPACLHSPPPDGPSSVSPAPVAPDSAADSAACLRCGVCCHSTLETYVRVTGEDWARLGDDAERVAHFIGHRAYLRMRDGHCASLTLLPDPETGRLLHVCSIYEKRPQICRELARGSPACEAELLRKAPAPAAPPLADLPRPALTP